MKMNFDNDKPKPPIIANGDATGILPVDGRTPITMDSMAFVFNRQSTAGLRRVSPIWCSIPMRTWDMVRPWAA
jgi:hypothetical protein